MFITKMYIVTIESEVHCFKTGTNALANATGITSLVKTKD